MALPATPALRYVAVVPAMRAASAPSESPQVAPPSAAGRGSWTALVAGTLVALLAGLVALRVAAVPLVPVVLRGGYGPGIAFHLAAREESWRRRDPAPGVVFGDSVFLGPTGWGSLVHRLEARLARDGRRVELVDATFLGLAAPHFAALAEAALAARPGWAVIEVNPRTIARDWWDFPAQRMPEVVALQSAARAFRARTSLAAHGIRYADVVTRQALDGLGVARASDGVRALTAETFAALGAGVNRRVGLAHGAPRAAGPERWLTAETAPRWYGATIARAPSIAVLRALGDELRAAGVTPLFVLAPVHASVLARLGIGADVLGARLARLRRALGASTAEWLDATDVVGEADFVDDVHVSDAALDRLAARIVARVSPGG